MKQWTRVIALKKKSGINLDFMSILNPTYWPLIGDKAKQFHTGDKIKLSIPNDLNQVDRSGNMPEHVIELRDKKNGTTGTILSIDQVQGVPGSDAQAISIQLDSGERLDKFPAAWLVKASKMFKIKKASDQNKIDIVINSLYGLDTSTVLTILRNYIDEDYFNFDEDEISENLNNFEDIYDYLVENYPTSEDLFDRNILDLKGHLDENSAEAIIEDIKDKGLVVVDNSEE